MTRSQRTHSSGLPARHLRPVRALLATVGIAALALVALPLQAEKAAAEPITVPYVDRLGCGTADAAVTPVFSWAGGGTAANGTAYTPTTAASAYPAPTGSFSGVTGGPTYTTYSPAGYGSDFQYRGTGALGFAPVTPGLGATLTIQLPHPQAMQFTVGGIQQPSHLQVSGAGPAGTVVPSAAPRSTAPGSATAATTGSAVEITGSVDDGAGDGFVRNAVDVWFSDPVTSITLTLSTSGGGSDAGFLVTAPIACQSGTVATIASVGPPAVDSAAGRVSHEVSMVTTVQNTSPASGAVLYPSATAPLQAVAEAQEMTLDAVIPGAASAAACTASAALDGSGPLIDPGAEGLEPGATCTLEWTATVSMPQSSADRTLDLVSSLNSSAASASRLKSQASTALTFPGLVSELVIADTGASEAKPGQQVTRSATITNNGEGAAIDTSYSLTAPAGATLSGLPSECTDDDATADCALGNIAPGASRTVVYSLTVGASVAPGTTLSVAAEATSSAQSAPATFDYGISVVATPVEPPVDPPAPPPDPTPAPTPTPAPAPVPLPAQRPLPPPSPAPSPTPSPAPSPEETAPPTGPPSTTDPGRIPVPLLLSFAGDELQPGTVSALRGTIGPIPAGGPVEISLSGRVNQGMVYRLVRILVDGEEVGSCVTQTREFTCTVTLQPGERAQIEVRLFADALNAPDRAIQQLSLNTGDGSGDNSRTVTTAVASGSSDTDDWKSDFTLDMSTLKGAFLPLTAMLLLALAATVAERRRP